VKTKTTSENHLASYHDQSILVEQIILRMIG